MGVKKENILCLITDRMNLGYCGVYGNPDGVTVALDAFAAEAVVADQYYTTTQDLTALYDSYWRRPGPPELTEGGAVEDSLPVRLRALGYRTLLITDESLVYDHPLSAGFDRRIFLPEEPPTQRAESMEETHLFEIFSALGSQIHQLEQEENERPWAIWAHLKGLGGGWDFPDDFSLPLFSGEESDLSEPEEWESLEPPSFPLEERRTRDPLLIGQLRAIRQTWCGGLALWDDLFAGLLNFLREEELLDDMMFITTSSRGIALGEHSWVGVPSVSDESSSCFLLEPEFSHLPLLVRYGGRKFASVRTSGLMAPGDLYDTILCEAQDGEQIKGIMLLAEETGEVLHSGLRLYWKDRQSKQRALVTSEWFLSVFSKGDREKGTIENVSLYVRPDDRWNVNDVADRCVDTVEELLPLLNDPDTPIVRRKEKCGD